MNNHHRQQKRLITIFCFVMGCQKLYFITPKLPFDKLPYMVQFTPNSMMLCALKSVPLFSYFLHTMFYVQHKYKNKILIYLYLTYFKILCGLMKNFIFASQLWDVVGIQLMSLHDMAYFVCF